MAFQLKEYLRERAHTRLSQRMGDRYAQIVLSFLTCLDDNNDDFGSGVESGDFIAAQFLEGILRTLHKISLRMLDDCRESCGLRAGHMIPLFLSCPSVVLLLPSFLSSVKSSLCSLFPWSSSPNNDAIYPEICFSDSLSSTCRGSFHT